MELSPNDSADIFANSSTETVTENRDTVVVHGRNALKRTRESMELNFRFCSSPLAASSPCLADTSRNSMMDSFITYQFISEACNVPICLYCPFCPEEFNLEFLLKDHIKLNHPNELKNIIRSQDEAVEFCSCPFCHAKYYVKELLPRHIVKKHQECAVSMFADGNPDKYAHCPFCTHKVLNRHMRLLSVHIEKKHYDQFQLAIETKFSSAPMDSSELKFFDFKEVSPCTSLSKRMMGLTTRDSDPKPKRVKSILKKTTSYPDGLNESPPDDVKELSTFSLNNSSYMLRKSARRRLRFNLPETPPSDSDNKENVIFSPNKKRNFSGKKEEKKSAWRSIFRVIKKDKKKKEDKKNMKVIFSSPENTKQGGRSDIQTTPVYSSVGFKGKSHKGAVTQFKCGLCLEGFTKNPLLLEHLRRCHKGIKLVPQYRCGECDAKFYRNTFLVRHCWYHHTPKCLKKDPAEC